MAAALDLTGVIQSFASPFTVRTQFRRSPRDAIACCAAVTVVAGDMAPTATSQVERSVVRLGLPSKGRMSEETLNLLKVCLIFACVSFSLVEVSVLLISSLCFLVSSELPIDC
jgi:hypothetical protein